MTGASSQGQYVKLADINESGLKINGILAKVKRYTLALITVTLTTAVSRSLSPLSLSPLLPHPRSHHSRFDY